jgi:hypothetical protein
MKYSKLTAELKLELMLLYLDNTVPVLQRQAKNNIPG